MLIYFKAGPFYPRQGNMSEAVCIRFSSPVLFCRYFVSISCLCLTFHSRYRQETRGESTNRLLIILKGVKRAGRRLLVCGLPFWSQQSCNKGLPSESNQGHCNHILHACITYYSMGTPMSSHFLSSSSHLSLLLLPAPLSPLPSLTLHLLLFTLGAVW